MKNQTTKTCGCCKKELPATSQYYSAAPRNKDGFQTYCRKCQQAKSQLAQAKKRGMEWALEGYESSNDHFNKALDHYAEIFNCPSLKRHKRS